MNLLSNLEANKQLKLLDGWSLEKNAIKKEYIFSSYMCSIRFINLLAEKAEKYLIKISLKRARALPRALNSDCIRREWTR